MEQALPVFMRLIEAGDALDRGEQDSARQMLEEILGGPPPADSVERLAAVFAQAMIARLRGDLAGVGNLYERVSSPGGMLGAFHVLTKETPIVRFGHEAANLMLIEALGADEPVTLLDIGIGSGVQWLPLFDRLAASGRRWPSLRLVGIDLPAAAADAHERLQVVGRTLAERAAAVDLPFEFTPVVGFVQQLDLNAIVSGVRRGRLGVNAALALHHVPDVDGPESRDEVLGQLRELKPDVVALYEPDVEHNTLPFRSRLVESMLHYAMVFDALDGNLEHHPAERLTLEQAFFGREIVNIVTGEGIDRVERHERHEAWATRFHRHGFSAFDMRPIETQLKESTNLSAPWGMTARSDALMLTWRDHPMLAASAWRPA